MIMHWNTTVKLLTQLNSIHNTFCAGPIEQNTKKKMLKNFTTTVVLAPVVVDY